MANCLQVTVAFPSTLKESTLQDLGEYLERYCVAREVVVTWNNFNVRVVAEYDSIALYEASDDLLGSICTIIEDVIGDELPSKTVITVKELMP